MYKYEKVKEEIKKDILQLASGSKVPSRNFLSKKHAVARATIDKVFTDLQREQLVHAVKGSGTFVAKCKQLQPRAPLIDRNSWGVIIPNVVSDVYPEMVRGIEDVASQNGINLIICNTDHNLEKEFDYIRRLADANVRGVVVVPAIVKFRLQEGCSLLRERKIPLVFCNRGIDCLPDAPLVCSNGFYGGYMATKHLIASGYEKISFIANKRYRTSIDRCYGYTAALMECGLPVKQSYILNQAPDDSLDSACEFARNLLQSQDRPDAFFCYNDMTAGRIYRIILELGLKISDDIGLIGFDNSDICEMMDTKLSTIEFQKYEIGKKAAQILLELGQGKALVGSNIFMFQPTLILRDSCKGKVPTQSTAPISFYASMAGELH